MNLKTMSKVALCCSLTVGSINSIYAKSITIKEYTSNVKKMNTLTQKHQEKLLANNKEIAEIYRGSESITIKSQNMAKKYYENKELLDKISDNIKDLLRSGKDIKYDDKADKGFDFVNTIQAINEMIRDLKSSSKEMSSLDILGDDEFKDMLNNNEHAKKLFDEFDISGALEQFDDGLENIGISLKELDDSGTNEQVDSEIQGVLLLQLAAVNMRAMRAKLDYTVNQIISNKTLKLEDIKALLSNGSGASIESQSEALFKEVSSRKTANMIKGLKGQMKNLFIGINNFKDRLKKIKMKKKEYSRKTKGFVIQRSEKYKWSKNSPKNKFTWDEDAKNPDGTYGNWTSLLGDYTAPIDNDGKQTNLELRNNEWYNTNTIIPRRIK